MSSRIVEATILDSVHNNPKAHESVARLVAGMMRPLVLPEYPLRPYHEAQTDWSLRRVLMTTREKEIKNRASVEQKLSIIDAMSLRYLDRPGTAFEDPQYSVSLIRRFCSGETAAEFTAKDPQGRKPLSWLARFRRILGVFKNSITAEDVARMEQFVDGKSNALILERAPIAKAMPL